MPGMIDRFGPVLAVLLCAISGFRLRFEGSSRERARGESPVPPDGGDAEYEHSRRSRCRG